MMSEADWTPTMEKKLARTVAKQDGAKTEEEIKAYTLEYWKIMREAVPKSESFYQDMIDQAKANSQQ